MTISRKNRHSKGQRPLAARQAPKEKKTFSLSVDALAYLNVLAKEYHSVSEALDALIRQQKEQAEKERVSASIRGYYDSISEEERAENKKWGEFVAANLSKE